MTKPMFQAACDVYQALGDLGEAKPGFLTDGMRLYALRIMEHMNVAEDMPRERVRSVGYARANQVKLLAAIEARWTDEPLDEWMRLHAAMRRLDEEITRVLGPSAELPSPRADGRSRWIH